MKALVTVAKGKVEVQEVSKPKLRDGHVLVKVKAVGLNPADWKNIDNQTTPGMRVGLDYSGVVEELGNGVTQFKPGDRIAGWVCGGNRLQPESGAFGEYTIAKAALQIKVPDNITDEQAATFGVSLSTVAQGLYKVLSLPWPNSPAPAPGPPILIYGGSTATGIYGIQFAKASGLTVLATASPHNFAYLRDLGADAVFDYHSPTCAADIKAHTANKLRFAWDCSGHGAAVCAGALSDDEEGARPRYATIIPIDRAQVESVNPRVDGPHFHLAYCVLGEQFEMAGKKWDVDPKEMEHAEKVLRLVPGLLERGVVRPVRTIGGEGKRGLEGVVEGLDELRGGRVSAGKLVYTL